MVFEYIKTTTYFNKENDMGSLHPKHTFRLGTDLESVQITANQLIVNAIGVPKQPVQIGDLILVQVEGLQLFGVVISKPPPKDGNLWLSATRVNFG